MSHIKFHIQINDIYFWGTGFAPGIGKIWYDYFKNLKSTFWRVVNEDTVTFLVSVSGGGMIHPADGFIFYCNKDEDDVVLEDLKNIFSDLAEKCKTSWSYSVEYFKGD